MDDGVSRDASRAEHLAEARLQRAEVFLNTKELAARWGVSLGWLARVRVEGRGPQYFQAPGKKGAVRYPLSAVLAYEASNMRRSTASQGGSRHGS